MPRIHCLLPVRDEADVIEECLNELLSWATTVFVFDTGSVDETWEIIQEMARIDKRIRPVAKDAVYFNDSIVRGFLFEKAREHMRDGDWFLRVDSDEFYHISPRDFIKEHLRKHETVAYGKYFEFAFTSKDLDRWKTEEYTLSDRAISISERRRYYFTDPHAEPRLFRYRSSMKWPGASSAPFHAGMIARTRLPIRHYPNRDPVQMKRRWILRKIMMADARNRKAWGGDVDDLTWNRDDWTTYVYPIGNQQLNYWPPGKEFLFGKLSWDPDRGALIKRSAKRLLYGGGVARLLDLRKEGWSDADYPQAISDEVQKQCEDLLSNVSIESCIQDLRAKATEDTDWFNKNLPPKPPRSSSAF